jgi:hypothetical protein
VVARVVYDRRQDGFVVVLMGGAVLGLALTIWFVVSRESISVSTVPLSFSAVGLLVVAAGIALMRRKVTVSELGITVESVLGKRELAMDKLAGIRLREEQSGRAAGNASLVILRDVDGRSITVSARGPAAAAEVRPWIRYVCEVLASRWRSQIESGATIQVCKGISLSAHELVVRKRAIALNGACKLREDAPGTVHAVMSLENGRDYLNVDAEYENYLPLVIVVRQLLGRSASSA